MVTFCDVAATSVNEDGSLVVAVLLGSKEPRLLDDGQSLAGEEAFGTFPYLFGDNYVPLLPVHASLGKCSPFIRCLYSCVSQDLVVDIYHRDNIW